MCIEGVIVIIVVIMVIGIVCVYVLHNSEDKIKEEEEKKRNDKIKKEMKEIEEKYKIGDRCVYLSHHVSIIGFHNYDWYFGYNLSVAGIRVQWWNSNNDLREEFIPYGDCQFWVKV